MAPQNYKAQYYDFDRKKKIYSERNKKVSFDITKEVCDQPEWTIDMIKQRHERLMKLADNLVNLSYMRSWLSNEFAKTFVA